MGHVMYDCGCVKKITGIQYNTKRLIKSSQFIHWHPV